MKLYHGTDLESAINIEKNGIDVFFNCDRRGDFGPGFYMTQNLEQAYKLARSNDVGAILKYKLNERSLKSLSVKVFRGFSKEWGNTINSERNKGIDVLRGYDFVFGKMADGNFVDLFNKRINIDEYISGVSNDIGDQVIAKTIKAVNALKYDGKVVLK